MKHTTLPYSILLHHQFVVVIINLCNYQLGHNRIDQNMLERVEISSPYKRSMASHIFSNKYEILMFWNWACTTKFHATRAFLQCSQFISVSQWNLVTREQKSLKYPLIPYKTSLFLFVAKQLFVDAQNTICNVSRAKSSRTFSWFFSIVFQLSSRVHSIKLIKLLAIEYTIS